MSESETFSQIFDDIVRMINARLTAVSSPRPREIPVLDEAIRYALLSPGKRIRSVLIIACAEALGAKRETALDVAISMECMQTYSLVHDDLPDMDDDDMRRGQPSVHVKYDPATAILVGDALQAGAFHLIADAYELSAQQRVDALRCLAIAAGRRGMVGGQQLDINHEVSNQLELARMHTLKTGHLIGAACELGGICANADEQTCQHLREFGRSLGLLFQIKDDILDEEDSATIGKTAGKDREAGKMTYVSLLGMERAQAELTSLITHTKSLLMPLDSRYNTEFLYWLVDQIATRKR